MKRRWNWYLWAGFLFCVAALVSYTFVLRQVSRHARHPLGQLPALRRGRGAPGSRLAARVWAAAAISREDYRPDTGRVQPRGAGVLLLRHLLYGEVAASFRDAERWAESAGVCAPRYEEQSGCTFEPAVISHAGLAEASERSAAGFLPRLLVTVLQLRVTGYRKTSGRN